MTRVDGRQHDELRPIAFERDFTEMSIGSVLVSFGRTRVLCTVSLDEDVPRWIPIGVPLFAVLLAVLVYVLGWAVLH